MFPAHSVSDEEFKQLADDILAFLRGLFVGPNRRKLRIIVVKVLAVAALVGTAIGAFVAIGQGLAIGFHPAFHRYSGWWLLAPLLAAALPVVLFAVAVFGIALPHRVGECVAGCFSDQTKARFKKIGEKFVPLLPFAVLLAGFAGMPVMVAYQHAKESNEILTAADAKDVAEVRKAIGRQREALNTASKASQQLLADLDKTVSEITETRQELAGTVLNLNTQLEAVTAANIDVEKLGDRQEQIRLRVQEFERLLDGQAPITKADLDSSGNQGLIIGAILGFLGSIAATFAYERLMLAFRAKDESAT